MHRKSLGTSKSTPRLAIMAHRTSSIKTHGMSSLRRPYTSRSSWHDNVASIACSRPNWIITIADALSGNHQVCHTWSHGVWRQHLQILHLVVFHMTWLGKFNLLRIVFFRRGQETFYGMCFSVEYFSFSTMNESQTFNAICQACQGQILQHETLTSIRRMWLQRGAAPPFGSRWNGEVFLSQPSCNRQQNDLQEIRLVTSAWESEHVNHACLYIYLFFFCFSFFYSERREPHHHGKTIVRWHVNHACLYIYLFISSSFYLLREAWAPWPWKKHHESVFWYVDKKLTYIKNIIYIYIYSFVLQRSVFSPSFALILPCSQPC